MLIWLIKDGEFLPFQRGSRRMRTGMLARKLVDRGHSVIWWASTFSHQKRKLLFDTDRNVDVEARYQCRLLHAGAYDRSVSLRRLRHHRTLGRRFREAIRRADPPQVIVCSFPIIEVAHEAIQFAQQHQIPVIVDVRDYWPDMYLKRLPGVFRPPANFMLRRSFAKTANVMRSADSLVGISNGILDWGLDYAGRGRGPNDKVFYIGYEDAPAHDISQTPPLPDYLQSLQEKTIFTFIGSFGSSYDLELVCDVAAKLNAGRIDNIHFVLGGSGDQYARLARRSRQLPNLTLPGWLNQEQIAQLLAHSHVGLMPLNSYRDSMPNKLYEFLSAGLPILSSLEGEPEQLLKKHRVGRTFPRNDAQALCEAVLALACDPESRKEMASRARDTFASRFRAEDLYTAYSAHVEKIAGAAEHEAADKASFTATRRAA